MLYFTGKFQVDDTGFNQRGAVLLIDFENIPHPADREQDTVFFRNSAAGEARAGSFRHHWYLQFAGHFQDAADFGCSARKDDGGGKLGVDGGVTLKDDEVFRQIDDVLRADDGLQARDKFACVHDAPLHSLRATSHPPHAPLK